MEIYIDLKKQTNDSYDIVFTKQVWDKILDFLLKLKKKRVLIISDSNVYPLYFEPLKKSIDEDILVYGFQFEAWEKSKDIETVLQICKKLIDLNFDRDDILISLWWWVVWDIVWMVAGIYKRWIDFIQIPTTLLSMFDSSVWWKTGIDYLGIKNIIWVFKQPKLVLINWLYLSTLDEEEILSWYFEWFKHSLIKSRHYFEKYLKESDLFFSKDFSNLDKSIYENVSVKVEIVMKDEKEFWVRKFLNFGHTLGHALESVSDFWIKHWVCVWLWMIYANILSNKLWILSSKLMFDINNFLLNKLAFVWIESIEFSFEQIYGKMLLDKKNTNESIVFVLLESPWNMIFKLFWNQDKYILKESYEDFRMFIKASKGTSAKR